MKYLRIFFASTLTLFHFITFSQLLPVDTILGVYEVDATSFDTNLSIIELDTSASNVWQIAPSHKTFFDSAYTIVTDSVNPYPVNNHSYFDLLAINEMQSSFFCNLIVEFRHKFQMDSLNDGGYITISNDSGQTWQNIMSDSLANWGFLHADYMYPQTDTLSNGEIGFTGTSDGWITSRFQWIWCWPVAKTASDPYEYFSQDTIQMRFNFHSDSTPDSMAGWAIDYIKLRYADMGGSVEELDYRINSNVFPNPSKGFTQIEFDNPKKLDFDVKVYNTQGQLIQLNTSTNNKNSIQFNSSEFKSGYYFYRIKLEDHSAAKGVFIVE